MPNSTATLNLSSQQLSLIAEKITQIKDKGFFERCWKTDNHVYQDRLEALGFKGFSNVLDAGCGYGQWSMGLSQLNDNVTFMDFDLERVETCQRIFETLGVNNYHACTGSIEALPFDDATFDAVYSYGVVCLTDYKKSLREFFRVLKPGGLCFFNTNDLGWYIYNMLNEHNCTEDFSSKAMAIETLQSTMTYFTQGTHQPGTFIVMPEDVIVAELNAIGFEIVAIDADGQIKQDKTIETKAFYPSSYDGIRGVYEILCKKA